MQEHDFNHHTPPDPKQWRSLTDQQCYQLDAGGFPCPDTPMQIIYYPEDLSRLWALDPSSQRMCELVAVDQEYTARLSLWKHRLIKQYARSHGEQDLDLAALKRAKARLQQLVGAERHLEKNPDVPRSDRWVFDSQIAMSMYNASPMSGDTERVEPDQPKDACYTGPNHQEKHSLRRNAMAEQTIPQETLFDPRQWRAMTPLERVTLIERMVITHARLTPLMTELDNLANYSGATRAGSAHCLAILGESGVGKTTLARSWITIATAQLQPSDEGKPTRPYRYISFSPQATPKAILASLLTELGDAVPPRGAEWAMIERLRRLVRASSVRILFIDDLHHLVNKDTQRIRYACVEMLEHLITQTGLSMVFLGSPRETEPILQVSPRLERLVGAPSILRPFEWNRENTTTIQEFRDLLKTIDLHLPFEPSGLSEEETAHRIYYATDGIISWIMKLIRYAAMSAIEAQETTLNRRRLAEAYAGCVAQTTLGVGKLNPFTDPDFHEGFHPRNGGRTNVKRVRISTRYWKEGDHHDQGNS